MDIFDDSTASPQEETQYAGVIQRRPDGTFLLHDGTYHIPNEGEWAAQWADLNAMWLADPSRFEQLTPPPEPEPPTLVEAKTAKLAEINGTAETTLAAMTATYPQGELLTFDKQEAEARAWLADNSAPTPLLFALAAGRGISLAELVQKVIAKADVFSAVSGYVIGQRQGLEDRLDAATSVDEVQAIVVTITLPEATA